MRVERIKKIIATGNLDLAHNELDTILDLGPSNIKALKLKASLLGAQGKFEEEKRIWVKVHDLDAEDLDSIRFLQRKQLEDREFFYFTDELPAGRKFLAYPKSVAVASLLGLLGCLFFFLLTHLATSYPLLATKGAVLTAFVCCIITPWVLIIYRYLTGLLFVVVTVDSIRIKSRLRSLEYRWEELSRVCLAHHRDQHMDRLLLVIVPRNSSAPAVKIDMSDSGSTLCARSYLIAEITKFCTGFEHTSSQHLNISNKNLILY